MIEVKHMIGPMWTVAGAPVVVEDPARAPEAVLREAASRVQGAGPWQINVTDGPESFVVQLNVDGSTRVLPSGSGNTADRRFLGFGRGRR